MRHPVLECMLDHFRRTFLVLKVISWQIHKVLVVEKEEEEKKRKCTYMFYTLVSSRRISPIYLMGFMDYF